MKIFTVILLSITFLAGESSYSQSLKNAEPLKGDEHLFSAYIKKFYSQVHLKNNDSAILTGKQIIKIRPHNAFITYQIGGLYEKTGDTVTSVYYYKRALVILDAALDTLNTKSWKYNWVKLNKAVVLILLDQKKAGDDIIEDLYNTETLNSNKQYYLSILKMTRKQVIYSKSTN
ncbi:MAG: tetratricopeptide repeat protein [Mucilaginibacter sp.]